MNDRDLLIAHMEDLAGKAIKTGCAASRFLTPAEVQSATTQFARRRDVILTLDSGYEDAEHTRAIFLNPDWGECDRTEIVAALKIEWRSQDTFGHRDILGALMALGIERDMTGDIVIDGHTAVLLCVPEMSGYIRENLNKAGRVGINVMDMPLTEMPTKQEDLIVKTDTTASLRLDAVLSVAFGISRGKATELIEAGSVNLNHQACLHPSKELSEGALLSVRGLGRAKLLEVGGISKKVRIFIKVGLYGR